jgi:predicted amidophosphoribosyltransferase
MVYKNEKDEEIKGIIYLVEYHAYWIDKSQGLKNPSFDKNSARVLDLKESKEKGIAPFLEQLEQLVAEGVSIAVVPSHDPEKTEGGIREMAHRLAANGRVDATGCLVRTKKIDKLATGGNRSVEVHLNSIEVREPELVMGKEMLLLDDVMTSGNSLLACKKLLKAAGAIRVKRLAIGKTA